MKNNLIGGLVLVVCSIVIVGSLLVPVINDVTNINGTAYNEGLYTLDKYETTDTFTAEWDYTAPYQFTVNGEIVTIPSTAGTYDYTIMGNQDFSVRFYFDSGTTRYVQVLYGEDSTSIYAARNTGSSASNLDVTLSSGVLTFDNNLGTTVDITLTDAFYCVTKDGAYIMKDYDETAYIVSDSELIAIGVSGIQNSDSTTIYERFFIEGSIDDGFTAEGLPYDVDVGTISATYSDSDNTDFVDLLDFSSLSFTATYDSTDTDVVYSQMIVPAEVTAERSQHMSSAEITLLNVMPLLAILVIVLGIIYAVFRNRDY